MSCRDTKGSSAVTSLATQLSGADEQTVQKVFHALKQEGRGLDAPAPTQQEWHAYLDGRSLNARHHGGDLTDARGESISERLRAARHEPVPDGPTFYALKHVFAEAQIAAAGVKSPTVQDAEDGDAPSGFSQRMLRPEEKTRFSSVEHAVRARKQTSEQARQQTARDADPEFARVVAERDNARQGIRDLGAAQTAMTEQYYELEARHDAVAAELAGAKDAVERLQRHREDDAAEYRQLENRYASQAQDLHAAESALLDERSARAAAEQRLADERAETIALRAEVSRLRAEADRRPG